MAQCKCVDRIRLFLFVISIFSIVYATNDTNKSSVITTLSTHLLTSISTFTSSSINHTAHLSTATTLHHVTRTSTYMSVSPTRTTSTPRRTSSGSITPTPTATVIPTTSFANFTTTIMPTTVKPSEHPAADCHIWKKLLDSERHYKWVAVAFDIIFAIALVVMTIMYLRQRKMYREIQGDGSLSRLI